jgi:hypothetical protein
MFLHELGRVVERWWLENGSQDFEKDFAASGIQVPWVQTI